MIRIVALEYHLSRYGARRQNASDSTCLKAGTYPLTGRLSGWKDWFGRSAQQTFANLPGRVCGRRTLAAFGISQESGLNEKEIVLTRDGLKKLEDELDELKTVHRREVNERIRQAKEFGDISENAEYEDAKQEQAFVEGRILKLEGMIRNARIIDQSDYVADEVHLGATVRVKETGSGSAHEFTIVGSAEADPKNARLSNESPVGRALMGRKQGDIVDVTTPRGQMKYKVESINKAVKKTKKAS
jgi:transcription elongation factor GreA